MVFKPFLDVKPREDMSHNHNYLYIHMLKEREREREREREIERERDSSWPTYRWYMPHVTRVASAGDFHFVC
jgi:hypothetical protein